jgi:pimeloyl-ACP methyl ester carboxylesterase
MGQHVDAGGVRTWYEERGEGFPLLLMHGGTATAENLAHQLPAFAARYRVLTPERRAHGHTHDVAGPLTFDAMMEDTVAFMDALGIERAHMVGHSDGGILAMLLASEHPDRVGAIVPIGGSAHPDGLEPELLRQLRTMDPEDWDATTIARHRAASPDGPGHWATAFDKIRAMWLTEPDIRAEQLGRIAAPTLFVAGDRDCILHEHTLWMFRSVPGAQLFIVPGTSHDLVTEKPGLVNGVILEFLAGADESLAQPSSAASEASRST